MREGLQQTFKHFEVCTYLCCLQQQLSVLFVVRPRVLCTKTKVKALFSSSDQYKFRDFFHNSLSLGCEIKHRGRGQQLETQDLIY